MLSAFCFFFFLAYCTFSRMLNRSREVDMLVFLKKLFILFIIYFWLRWVFTAARGLSPVAVSGGYSSLRCVGFSSCGSQAPGRRLSSCGTRA